MIHRAKRGLFHFVRGASWNLPRPIIIVAKPGKSSRGKTYERDEE